MAKWFYMVKVAKGGEKWGKVRKKVANSWEKWGKNGEKLEKVGKS